MMNVWSAATAALAAYTPQAPIKPRRYGPRRFSPGDTVGQWTLLEFIPGYKHPTRTPARWECRCSCGRVVQVRASNLGSGASQSCGHDRAKILAVNKAKAACVS